MIGFFRRRRRSGETSAFGLLTVDEAKAWVRDHPQCSLCPHPIRKWDNYTVINDSHAGISAHHVDCSQAGR